MELIIINDTGGDWIAVYINGFLEEEGHSIDWPNFIYTNMYNRRIEAIDIYELDFEEHGRAKDVFRDYDLSKLKFIKSKYY